MNYEEDWRRALLSLSADDSIGAHIAERVLPSAHLDVQTDGKAYAAARCEGIKFAQQSAEKFEDMDVLAMPTIRTLPPKLGRVTANTGMDDLLGNTTPFSLTGMPADHYRLQKWMDYL